MDYIDLSRRFRDLPQSELESPEFLASLNETHWPGMEGSSIGWSELLEYPRVLVLAEAGSGKTREMQGQAARLRAEGQFAFFVPLEELHRQNLAEILDSQEERELDRWKSDGVSPAWFFLDAVDELKLIQGKLGSALNRFAKAIDGNLNRARCVISCRPSDFRPSIDRTTVQEKLPFSPSQDIQQLTPDEFFVSALSEKKSGGETKESTKQIAELRIVVLLPLSDAQISTFVGSLGVVDPASLIEEIRRRDAWTFASRPLDLILLAESWKVNKRLGTRAEQHEANVAAKLKDDPDRPDKGVLSGEKARRGADQLALALALTQTWTILSPDQILDTDRAEGVLDSSEILTDWTDGEHQAILRRGLFAPATYGRVRFHHRSVQEYLAACRLRVLRRKGMSARKLHNLLFAELYDVRLVKPSMQAIAAWLALWDDDVRRELMDREPETLLSLGDPESLSIGARAQLLRSFSKLYGEGGWRGLNIPRSEILRLADPQLAGVVRQLWEGKPSSPEVAELLLGMIWHGPIGECADIARSAALDVSQSATQRVFAIRALIACGKTEALHEVRESILSDPEKWPDRVVHTVAGDLFPSSLSVSQLISLVRRTPEPRDTEGFSWTMRQVVEAIEPSGTVAIDLRDSLAGLIWQGRYEVQDWYGSRGRYDYVAPALALLCDRQLKATSSTEVTEDKLIWACVVANRFSDEEIGLSDVIPNLKKHFQERAHLREAAFWAEHKVFSEAVEVLDSWDLYWRSIDGSLVEHPISGDRAWLLDALRNSLDRERQLAALHELMSLWISGGREVCHLDALVIAVQGDAELTTMLLERSVPPKPLPGQEERRRQSAEAKLERESREAQRLEGWKQWREDLLSDTDLAFASENLPRTREMLYEWIRAFKRGTRSCLGAWDADALRKAFSADIAARAEKEFQVVWRANPPTLKSERPPGDNPPRIWCEGLAGLSAEAMTPGWATRLSPEVARIAATYATLEWNGFPCWLRDVVAVRPEVVCEVLWRDLSSEFAKVEVHSYPRTLQALSCADREVKTLLAPLLSSWLPNWPTTFQDEKCRQQSANHLEQVLDIISDVVVGQERREIAEELGEQFSSSPNGPLALAWLRGLFQLDSERAIQALESALKSFTEDERSGHAVAMFAHLFGDRGAVALTSGVTSLSRLVRCAYLYLGPGVNTPDVMGEPEQARRFLLGKLLDAPGGARAVILDLAPDPSFQHFSDRLLLLARRRAAIDAEGPALRPEDVVALEKRFEAPPQDRDGLFTLMIDRLDDMAHDIAHDDFTDRRILQKVGDEREMQVTLARRLRESANGSYIVAREEEVADLKKTDIRLLATRGDQKAVIEVKIADKRWTLPGLEGALRDQLVGQYLRHATCKAGCLLLTYSGKKKYWEHPENGRRLCFSEVVVHLKVLARSIEEHEGFGIRLAVFSLDLTDPLSKPAPKGKQTSRKRPSANVRPL